MLLKLLRALTDTPAPGNRVADRYANVAVVDQFGRTHRFRDAFVDGRALIVNSMYTTCRGTCPGTSARLKTLRRRLSPILGDALVMVSFTLEPEIDTPEVLRDYAELYGANDRGGALCPWHFVTGRPADVERLRRSLGFYDLNPRVDADITQHGTVLLFGNGGADRWAALSAEMSENTLVEAIRRVAGSTIEQRYGIPG